VASHRPWPSIADLREVSQPAHIRDRRNAEHWTAHLFTRSISIYLTRIAVWLGLSANTVTVVMILSGWAAAASLLIPGLAGPLAALFFAVLQMVLDSIDGEVARWNRATSPRGIFLDRFAHTTTESLIPLALGLRLALESDPTDWRWAAAAGGVSMLVLVNKSLNEAARLALVESGLPLDKGVSGARTAQPGLMRKLRRAAEFLPLHRMYHSVEQTLVIALLALVGVVAGFNGPAMAFVLLGLAIPVVVAGHMTAILVSPILRRDHA
jgi:phosphatidylglycerophosphate synthase